MSAPSTFQGGVFSDQLPGGRAGATLAPTHKAIEAQANDGTLFAIPLGELQLDIGGASGKMVFCRNQDKSLTFFTEAPGFLDAIEAQGGHHIQQLTQGIRRTLKAKRTRSVSMWLGVIGLVVGLGVCTVQALGSFAQTSADSIPWTVDAYIGETAIESMELGGPKVEDEAITAVPNALIQKLGESIDIPDLKLEIHVVESEQINAFALPGGQMVVFTGLLRRAKTPEEVAGVLAHEIAHVTERHGIERIIQSVGVITAVQLLMGDATGVMAMAAQLLTVATINNYSRDQETEADEAGVALLVDAGINPSGLAAFFEVLKEESSDTPQAMQEALSWMSTHPDTDQRIEDVHALTSALPNPTYEPLVVPWDAMKAALNKTQEP